MPGASARDRQLLMEVERGNLNAVKKLLAGGANVNGSNVLDNRPLFAAARAGNATMLKLLISKGADLELESRFPGGRAVHAAISGERLDALRVLIESGVNLNSKDSDGQTPLMLTSLAVTGSYMAEELLRAGANPAVGNHQGMTALHVAAGLDNTLVMGVILAKAPSLLNALDGQGFTAMGTASLRGQKRAVSFLLEAGASDRDTNPERGSILWAADGGHDDMVHMMLEHDIDRVGGLHAIPNAMGVAIQGGKAKMLQRLISVEGEEKRQAWAECILRQSPALHVAAVWCSLRPMHVLLAAGAREEAMNVEGKRASDVIGAAREPFERDSKKEAAMLRMLQRGPAFRARSWAWSTEVIASGVNVVKRSNDVAPPTPLGHPVRVYRSTGTRAFATRFARYAEKKK